VADVIESELSRFDERYGVGAEALLAVERAALGTDYGANGYTTRAEADEIGERLGLDADTTLLDLGSGCGWPGLHLAARSGCRLVSFDPVFSGVHRSAARADADGLTHRHVAAVVDGGRLPLADRSVDAIVHVDVLC
jgi:cyclopropane fatty-acyl-phospholipid synthase-like methyltransferase